MNETTDAAVLVPVVYAKGESPAYIGFVLRSPNSTTHAGHIGFPGGKVEFDDGSLRDAALRETDEELALETADVDVVGTLDPHHTRSSDFAITPFIGAIRVPERFTPNSREVTETFWVSESTLKNTYRMDGDRIRYPVGDGREVWGVTARIVTSVLVSEALKKVGGSTDTPSLPEAASVVNRTNTDI